MIERALAKIQGSYPKIPDAPLWTLWGLNTSTDFYSNRLMDFRPRDLVSSAITTRLNAAGETTVSLRSVEMYNEMLDLVTDQTCVMVRNLEENEIWFTIDSMTTTKEQDSDTGTELWKYEVTLLDIMSIGAFTPLVNNRYVTIPSNWNQEDAQNELPPNYMKYSMGQPTEVEKGEIVHDMFYSPFVVGDTPNPSNRTIMQGVKFKGLTNLRYISVPASQAYYSTPEKSWINTECGEVTITEKLNELDWTIPVEHAFRSDKGYLFIDIYSGPRLHDLQVELNDRAMGSYTAGYKQAEGAYYIGKCGTWPQISVTRMINNKSAPFMKYASISQDVDEGTTLANATTAITNLVNTNRSKTEILKYIDTQITTTLKPWDDFLLGDIMRVGISGVVGFSSVDLRVDEISEAIESDAIVYTLSLSVVDFAEGE